MAKTPVKSPSRSSGAGRRGSSTRRRSQAEIEAIRKVRERQIAATARRRPRRPAITPLPFERRIPISIAYNYYVIRVYDTGFGIQYVTLLRRKGEPPLTDAVIDRQLNAWWAAEQPVQYQFDIVRWEIVAIYR